MSSTFTDETICSSSNDLIDSVIGNNTNLGVLNWHQVNKLDSLLNKLIPIHGRGNYPTLTVRLKDFIRNLNKRLIEQRVKVRDIRINGGVASYVLAHQDDYEFSDIDIIFSCDLLQLNDHSDPSSCLPSEAATNSITSSPETAFSNCCDTIKQTVFECLLDYFPQKDTKVSLQCVKDAYVKKMVKIYQQASANSNEANEPNESAESMQSSSRWSLISLCNDQGQNIELKFVDKMKRQFQFSVDAFQIHLASLLKYYDLSDNCKVEASNVVSVGMDEKVYPTVIAESMYGEFNEANFHLNAKLIATKSPEEIRGGGLLKYCNLLVRGYKPVQGGESQMNTMEKYMCSRFFIDFSDLSDQEHKLNAYLDCHFQNAPHMCLLYLQKLYQVVNSSTVCLMGHERKQTLNLIESLAKRYQDEFSFNNSINEQLTDSFDSESVGSESSSSSLSSSSASSLSYNHQNQHQHHQHPHHHQRNMNNFKYRLSTASKPSSVASSPSSSICSAALLEQTQQYQQYTNSNSNNNGIFSRSPSNDYNYNQNQIYFHLNNQSKYSSVNTNNNNNKQHQLQQQHQMQQQQQPHTSNKLTLPFSSSSTMSSSSSSSVVSSPSPSPPLAATSPTIIPFYVTISTPTPQEEDDDEKQNDEVLDEDIVEEELEEEQPQSKPIPTSVFQCKIPSQCFPYIEVFNYYSPPIIAASATSSNASSPVYFYTDPNNIQEPMNFIHANNVITRIIPSKSFHYSNSTNSSYQFSQNNYYYLSSKQQNKEIL